MKKIYFVLGALLSGSQMLAQLTITRANNEPVIGDVNTTKKYDSATVIPKTTGASQTWNFNTSLSVNGLTETVTYTTVAASPSPATFSAANMAAMRSATDWDFWKTSPSMIEFAGNRM